MVYNKQHYIGFHYIYFKFLFLIYIYYILSYLKKYIKHYYLY